jgi:predicted nucleic acid-binding protein
MKAIVLDASVLSAFARAGEIALLGRILEDHDVVVTEAVVDELERGAARFPELREAARLPWIRRVGLRGLNELGVFAEYAKRLGSGPDRDVGEATVLAWAECHEAIAIVDETAGGRSARSAM